MAFIEVPMCYLALPAGKMRKLTKWVEEKFPPQP